MLEATRGFPTGTITFLFTDIEGSTRLVQRFGDAYPPLLERHQAILRAAFETHRGVEVGTEGDSFFVVFVTASDAIAAALEGQRAIEDHPWPDDGRIRVRMGLHTGEGTLGAGSYVGVDVHRAARIASAGHGGQVLLSDSTRALVERDRPQGVALRDLGSHRLKDLLEGERIYQLEHPALETEFPPLTTLTSRPNNLPTQPSAFLGREGELADIRQALDQGARLVTLTGPGGIGKTRLSLQAAAELSGRFVDGVFFVDLSPIRTTDTAFEAIVRAIDEVRTDEPALEQLKRSLEPKRVLLLLDNLEQVIEVADGVLELIQRCGSLHVLATSREPLHLRGERLVPVPPLGLPPEASAQAAELRSSDAVRLFLERAHETQPHFDPSDAEIGAIAEICVRLDGLPLAIELAAARLNLFSPGELRDRLRERVDALGRGARDLPARQRTLRTTIEWSYELLDTGERALFRVLAVFPSARPADVEAVADASAAAQATDVLDDLESLVDKSLARTIEGAGGRRVTMLGTIREYASERLHEDPLGSAIERAHAEHFAAMGLELRDRVYGADREEALGAVEADLGNLMTAWRYWSEAADLERLDMLLDALWVLHDARGWYHGALELSNGLLDVLGRIPASPERAREEITVRTSLARGLMAIRGYTQEVEDAYRHALTLAEEAGGLPEQIPVLRSLAALHLYRAEFDRGLEIGRQLLALADTEGDVALQVEGHLRIGTSLVSLGDADIGLEHLEKASALFDPQQQGPGRFRLGPSPGVTSQTTSAFVLWLMGSADQARSHAARALAIADRLGQPYTLAYARFHVGLLNAWERRWDNVRAFATDVHDIACAREYQVWRATSLVLNGLAATALGEGDRGLEMSDEGVALYREMTAPPVFWPLILALRARTFANLGRPSDGLEVVDQAIELAPRDVASVLAPQFPVLRGDLLVAMGDTQGAGFSYEMAMDLAQRSGARMNELQAATALVHLSSDSDRGGALDRLRAVYDTFSEGFDAPDVVAARSLLRA